MKKLFIAASIALFGFTANAQEEQTFGFAKGDVLVEGNLSVNSSTETDSNEDGDISEIKSSSFNFNPKAGYFVTDKLAVGVELSLMNTNEEDTDFTADPNFVQETKTNTFGAGVFARYYFLELGKRFKTYGEFGFGYASGNIETNVTGVDTPVQDYDVNGISTGIDLGINYFVTENFAINFGLVDVLSYNSLNGENNLEGFSDEYKSNEFNANLNVFNNFFQTAQFGLTWKF